MKRKVIYGIPVIAGILFCLYYLYLAADNVAYSDYIRLINAYLPDVGNPDKFFVPDILTRVPLTYLGRIVNVAFFDYSTMFDMLLGVLSLGLGAAAMASYAKGKAGISYIWYLFVILIYFGLNKWEMLTNGTGWVCFLSISGFCWHYLILDHAVKTGHSHRQDRILLLVLPSLLTIFVAGPYCGSYSALLTLVYAVMLALDFKENRKVKTLFLLYLAAVLVPLFLYLLSNASAVYVHRGAVEGSILQAFIGNPVFFVRFILKSFASVLVGMNQLTALAEGGVPGGYAFVYILGAIMICLYLAGLFLTWKHRVYKRTIFPLLLILSGGLNHVLILAARWIFLKDYYGMSSRYSIQYQMGLIGIVWTFAIVNQLRKNKVKEDVAVADTSAGKAPLLSGLIGAGIAVIMAGSLYTTLQEIKTAPYRKEYLKVSREIGLNYRNASDEELETYLHHDPAEVRKAMGILEENKLNIFKDR